MTEYTPEYTLPTRSPYQLPVLAEENSLTTKLLNANNETGDLKVKKQSKLSKYYESKQP
jgi:hypothetical protein